jgi:hypothetical protein
MSDPTRAPRAQRLAKLRAVHTAVRANDRAQPPKSPAPSPVGSPARDRPTTAVGVVGTQSYLRLERC